MQGEKDVCDSRRAWAFAIGLAVASALFRLHPYYAPSSPLAGLWNFGMMGALGLFVGSRLRSGYCGFARWRRRRRPSP